MIATNMIAEMASCMQWMTRWLAVWSAVDFPLDFCKFVWLSGTRVPPTPSRANYRVCEYPYEYYLNSIHQYRLHRLFLLCLHEFEY